MTRFGLAQSIRRVEDPRLLTGGGRYTDDIVLPGMLHGVVLRSPHAAAKLGAIDTASARSVPGVKAIYTAADLNADGIAPMPCAAPVQNRDGSDMASPPHPALADGMVRHVGDPVAFIVAETAKAARDAAELIAVDYDMEPAVTDIAVATDSGVPLVWPSVANNIAFDWEIGDKAATDALFGTAAHVTRLTVVNNRVIVASMEARAAIADYDTVADRWTLYANTQGGWLIKALIGAVFQTEPANFRIITPDVGGGFGMKAFLYAEHVLTCYAARKLGKPVKWASERGEAFLSDTHGRDNVTLGELAIDRDGQFLALRTRNLSNMGAYLSTFAPYIPTLAGGAVLSGVYNFRQIYANVLGVFTHTVPVDAYRGAGRPESNYLLERLVDAAARELGIDRRNCAGATWCRHRRCRMPRPSARPTTPATSRWCWMRRSNGWTTQASLPAARMRRGGEGFAASASHTISRSRWAIRPSGRKSVSPTTATSTFMLAPNRPARVTRPPISSSHRSASALTARRSAFVRATRTPSRSAAARVARAACIPKVRRS